MFALAYELHQPVTVVEAMTHREVLGWFEFLSERKASVDNPPPAAEEGGIPYSMLSKADKKAMFGKSSAPAKKKRTQAPTKMNRKSK